jgi:hypothetical protein
MSDDADSSARPYERIPLAEAILGDLGKLRQCGMNIACAKSEQACREARESQDSAVRSEPPTGRDPAEAFNRVSRHVRFIAALELMMADYLAALRAGDPCVEFWPRGSRQKSPRSADPHDSEAKPEPDRKDRRDQLHGFVLDLAHPMSYEPVARERIYENLHERLYETERYDLLLDLSTEEAVETICKDLGVRPQYERWEGLDWPPWRVGKPAPDPSAWKSRAEELAREPATEPAREPECEETVFTVGTPPWPPP